MQHCNFLATLAGKNWSLKGSSWEAGRKAYSFITVSASPPKNSMYSPANECKIFMFNCYCMREGEKEGKREREKERRECNWRRREDMTVQRSLEMQRGLEGGERKGWKIRNRVIISEEDTKRRRWEDININGEEGKERRREEDKKRRQNGGIRLVRTNIWPDPCKIRITDPRLISSKVNCNKCKAVILKNLSWMH